MSENEKFNEEVSEEIQNAPDANVEAVAETEGTVAEGAVDTAVEEAAAEEASAEEAPAEEAPAEEAPAEEAPAEEAPAEEVPAEETAAQNDGVSIAPESGSYQSTVDSQAAAAKPAEKKSSKKGIIIAVVVMILVLCLLLVLCCVGVIFMATKKTKVKLDEYVGVVYDGADGYGTASYSFDSSAFTDKYIDKINFNSSHEDYSYYHAWYGDNAALALVNTCIDYTVSPTEGLSNGDTVTVTFECDDELAKKLFNSKLVYSETLEFTVKGLEELDVVDPFEGVEIELSGYDTDGTAYLTINNIDSSCYYLSYQIDVSEGLSNGDVITVSVAESFDTYKELMAENYGVTVSATEKEYVVEGLEELVEIDPFEDIVLTYSGYEPYGSVNISSNSSNSFIQNLYFTADKSSNLSNGDEITVTVSSWYSDLDEHALDNGYVLTQTSKTYTVDGVYTYYTDAAELPEDMVEQMNKEAVDYWTSKTASTYDSAEVQSIQHIGTTILTTKKEFSTWSTNTYVYMLYEIKAKVDYEGYDENGSAKTCNDVVTSYVYVCFKNAAEIDGEWSVDLTNYDASNYDYYKYDTGVYSSSHIYSWSDTVELSFYSYETFADMYNEMVTVNLADYTYTSTLDANGQPLEENAE